MNKIALAAVFSLLAGFAVGAWFGGGESEGDRSVELASDPEFHEDASMEDRLQRLEQIIVEERDARITL